MTSPASAATILIVDDEIQNRKVLEALLRPEGYRTLTAAGGTEALALVAQHAPDLILLDVMMPGMDGYQVASTLKASPATSNIPIIIVTASIDRSTRLAGLAAGAEEFLIKPVERTELWLRVRNLLRLKTLSDLLQNHSSVLEREVQARTESLRESERRFSHLLGNIEMASVMLDANACITYCNDYLLRLTGWQRAEVMDRNWFEVFVPPETRDLKAGFAALLANNPEAWHHENEILTRPGERRLIRWNNSVLRSGAGDVIGTASIGEDITEQKKAEEKIRRQNRVYAVLSGINTLIVRATDRKQLFDEACRISVKHGGFGMVWIGLLDAITLDITPVAWGGYDNDDEWAMLKSTARDVPEGQGSIGQAVRDKRPIVVNDMSADATVGGARRRKAIERGFRSTAALPLIVDGQVAGTFVLFAKEVNFFSEEEIRLLTELAGDISYALEHIAKVEKIARLSRIQAVMGAINSMIVRVGTRQELFDEACRIAVDDGNFGTAWIGEFDPSTFRIRPVAWSGPQIHPADAYVPDVLKGTGMVARSIREKRPVFDNDITAPTSVGGQRRSAAIQAGFRSLIALPFIVESTVVGHLALYTKEPNFFNEDELKLLTHMAGNISFALANIARQQKLDKLARIRAVSSEINATIIRIHDREALLRETCRIAVEHGKFDLVWIGTVDTAKQEILPVVWNGFSPEIAQKVSWKSSSTAGGTLGEAIRTAKPTVRNDIETEMASGGMRAEALKQGCLSTVCMPLVVDNNVVVLISLFAPGKGFFDEDELALLNEVAADVSFALQDIEKQKKLEYLSHYDVLTGLPNRTLFHETLKRTLALASDRGWLVAVLCIDLDYFKNVNDTLGHACGDALLAQFSSRLLQCVRIRDTVGRLGGDEFAVILLMEDGKEGAAHVANKIREVLRAPFELKGHEAAVTASIGITIHPDDASDPETLMKYADTAMYRAKQAGRDTFRFFTAQMNTEVVARLDMETALRKAVENGEFVLHYQPKVQLNSGRIAGVEALLRWQRPGHGLVPPNEFIPVLEETGLIVRVGSWVIATACRQVGQWMRSPIGPVQVSVNVSGRQFIEGDLNGDVVKALGDNSIAADLLDLEMTESSLMANTERTIASLQNLKKLGVQISIDDFGTGYSSLAYLSRFPVDTLKIDIAFIRDVTSNPDHAAIVLAIIRMAHGLKLDVVAEGVETAAQLEYLRRHRCDLIQGYFFSRPLPLLELEQMLREGRSLPAPEAEPGKPLQTLLLVDDEARELDVLQRLLNQDGYHILSARSAAEGFELLALHPVQVILCDQRMPDMSGTDFLGRVRDLYSDTFRIVLSAHAAPETIMDAVNRGALHRFYTKPWDSRILRENIREAFRHYWLLHDAPLRRQGTDPDNTLPPRRSAVPGAQQNKIPSPLTLGSAGPLVQSKGPLE